MNSNSGRPKPYQSQLLPFLGEIRRMRRARRSWREITEYLTTNYQITISARGVGLFFKRAGRRPLPLGFEGPSRNPTSGASARPVVDRRAQPSRSNFNTDQQHRPTPLFDELELVEESETARKLRQASEQAVARFASEEPTIRKQPQQ
jgi:hypothetical protein